MSYSRREVVDGQTVMNKDLYDNLQDGIDDLIEATTVFNQDGSITTNYGDRVKNTVFNQDGSITENISKNGVVLITKTTTFNADGSITEEVEQ